MLLELAEAIAKALVLGSESFQLKYKFAIDTQVKVSADMIMKEVSRLEMSLALSLLILHSCKMGRMSSSKTLI